MQIGVKVTLGHHASFDFPIKLTAKMLFNQTFKNIEERHHLLPLRSIVVDWIKSRFIKKALYDNQIIDQKIILKCSLLTNVSRNLVYIRSETF